MKHVALVARDAIADSASCELSGTIFRYPALQLRVLADGPVTCELILHARHEHERTMSETRQSKAYSTHVKCPLVVSRGLAQAYISQG